MKDRQQRVGQRGGIVLDHRIIGATVVDGTGAPAVAADIGIRDGRIVAIVEPGARNLRRLWPSSKPRLCRHAHALRRTTFLGSIRRSVERSRCHFSDRG